MTISTTHQVNVFMLCILSGILCGICFDFERSIRKIYGSREVEVVFQDIIFACVCAAVLIVAGYFFNNGEIRYYQILGTFCGALFYSCALSSFFIKFFCFFHKMVIKIFVKPLLLLLRKITNLFKRAFSLFLKLNRKISRKYSKVIKKFYLHIKRLKKRIKML